LSIQSTDPINTFKDCLKHDRNLCHECKDVGMCDGQAADDCDIMNLDEFEITLNNRMAKLDDQFDKINESLKTKKEALKSIYRKNPRISHDCNFLRLQTCIENLDAIIPEEEPELEAAETVETISITESKQIIVCDSFSNDNKNMIVSSCKRSVKKFGNLGYCFLNHPKIEKNQILKWSLRVPKFDDGWIGIVLIFE